MFVLHLARTDRPAWSSALMRDASAAAITRGPYLQIGTPTSMIVRWRTDVPAASHLVWGTNLAGLDQVTQFPLTRPRNMKSRLRVCPRPLRYYYSAGDRRDGSFSGASTNQYWITSPAPGEPHTTRFWVLGDPGLNTIDQAGVINAYRPPSGPIIPT